TAARGPPPSPPAQLASPLLVASRSSNPICTPTSPASPAPTAPSLASASAPSSPSSSPPPPSPARCSRDQDAAFANRDVPAAARVIAYGGEAEIVWNPNGPVWRMLRRACVREMLCPAGLDAVYDLRRREVRAAVRSLRARAGSSVDVGAEMFLTVMNVITSTLWGGTLEDREERSAVGKEFQELVAEITELLGRPNVSDFFPALARFDLQGIQRQMHILLERFDRIFESIIERRKRRLEEGGRKMHGGDDFLDHMLRLEAAGGDDRTPFTMTNVKALLMVSVLSFYSYDLRCFVFYVFSVYIILHNQTNKNI
ncbi:cytochrome P450, partial [Musa troglodytarum]